METLAVFFIFAVVAALAVALAVSAARRAVERRRAEGLRPPGDGGPPGFPGR